jgi:hypothetical protein
MSRILVAVETCARFKDRARSVRDTWMPDAVSLGYDVQFFDGARLNVPDDYLSLPFKTRAICAYAREAGYRNLLKVDDDTYVRPKKLVVPSVDYAGRVNGWFCSGGAYWLSERAIGLVADAETSSQANEDMWVGNVLKSHGIDPVSVPNFFVHFEGTQERWIANSRLAVLMQIRGVEAMHKAQNPDTSLFPKPCPNCGENDFRRVIGGTQCQECRKVYPPGRFGE